ncbi:Cyclic-di-GMP-binding biofilm dispersal mediator protein [Mycolicibacterium vanbaalenii]|uniref:Cyclic-di-GMP-binding biofilm dispersal mediator protein n=1 Tax=Mycolicibacterium vanbaalenii TaxID=110539 RepID=A0A5S9R4I3_MYCVN|nr:3-oxoacyl-ACP reductase family protein [Mycolicibacterium vanbaalenii]CAA0127115.1 Cyclic-di-GMP-binding biofilm dispersal mediator protein [Mycolicibacterium vanbaalenii]
MTTPVSQSLTDSSARPLAGRRALVTGGSRGIGAAIVRRLADDGATVTFTYHSSPQRAAELVAQASESGSSVTAVQADSADAKAIRRAVDATADRLGGLDILVNNAGVAHLGPVESFPMDQFDHLVAVNVRGVFAAIQAVVPHMDGAGRIITIGSVNGDRVHLPTLSVYAMTKAAVAGLTRGLARELGPRGITVNNLAVGPTETEMNPDDDSEIAGVNRATTALGRYGQPHDIASAVAYLALPEAGFVTGATWHVDGGFNV